MKTYITALFLIPLAFSCFAQNTIKPGDKTIKYDWIKTSHDFYKNTMTDSLGNKTFEFMMDNVTIVDSVNKRIIFARTRQVPVGNFMADTSVTDLNFKPISMHEVHVQRKVSFDMEFGDTQATVKTIRKGVLSVKSYPMQPGYFEDNMSEYIFAYLELKKGVTYIMDNFNQATPGSDPYTIAWAFDDIWNLPGDNVINCTVLHFTHGGTTGYVWIDKRTHEVLKQLGHFKNGSYLVTKQ